MNQNDHALNVNLHVDGLNITVNHIISADHALVKLINLIRLEIKNMADSVQAAIDQLTADVAAETAANQSAITLIQGFAAQLAAAVAAAQAAGATPAQLQALTDLAAGVESNTTQLAAAVAAVPAA